MDENRSFDVIIIGLGPVGAVVANLLARFNISICGILYIGLIPQFPLGRQTQTGSFG